MKKKNSKVNLVNRSYKWISYLVPLLVLVVAISGYSGTAKGDDYNLPPETPYASNFYAADANLSTDGYYNFTAFDQDIIYQKDVYNQTGDFVYLIPVAKNDMLDINVYNMSANAMFISTDLDGFALMLTGTPEAIKENLTEHVLWEYSQNNSTSYNQRIVANNDTIFCLAVLPSDLEQPCSGHITVTRYSESPTAIDLGVNGTEIREYYQSLNAAVGQVENTPEAQTTSDVGTDPSMGSMIAPTSSDSTQASYEAPLQLTPPAYIPASMLIDNRPYGFSTELAESQALVDKWAEERAIDNANYF
jgi:hypothetical protein